MQTKAQTKRQLILKQKRAAEKKRRARKGSTRNMTVFLGHDEERERRIAAFDEMAIAFGMSRSQLFQAIADHVLVVKAKAPTR